MELTSISPLGARSTEATQRTSRNGQEELLHRSGHGGRKVGNNPGTPSPGVPAQDRLSVFLERLLGVRIDPERLEGLLRKLEDLDYRVQPPAEPQIEEPAPAAVSPREIRARLIAFGREVSDELRGLSSEVLKAAGDVSPRFERDLKFAIKRVGDAFRSDLRRAFRAAREGKEVDQEQLTAGLQKSFDGLTDRLETVFRAAGDPDSFRGTLGRIRRGDEPGYRAGAEPTIGRPLSSPRTEPSGAPGRFGLPGTRPTAGRGDAAPSVDLSGLRARFEQLLGDLADRFAGEAPEAGRGQIYVAIEDSAPEQGERLDAAG